MNRLILGVLCLVACKDSSKNALIDAAPDAPIDASPDAASLPAGSQCRSSADCGADPTQTACCLLVHVGGSAEPTRCGAPQNQQRPLCGEVACDPASTAPCITVAGSAGACVFAAFGPSNFSHYWVCR
jgi:hypothetical protein